MCCFVKLEPDLVPPQVHSVSLLTLISLQDKELTVNQMYTHVLFVLFVSPTQRPTEILQICRHSYG